MLYCLTFLCFLQDVDSQAEYFLKSFIFGLSDDWTKVNALLKEWKLEFRREKIEGETLNEAQMIVFGQRVCFPLNSIL